MNIVQVCVMGVIGVLLAVQFKSGRSEYSIYISVAVSLAIFFYILSQLKIFAVLIEEIGRNMELHSAYIKTLLKMLGITYVSEFASAICKDAGYQSIAGQIEVFAKLFILGLSAPILLSLMDVIKEFLV